MAFFPCDFVDSDSGDLLQVHMRSAPLHRVLHRSQYSVSTGVKAVGNLGPAQLLGPASQKPYIAGGYRSLAFSTWNRFNHNAATRTVHPSLAIQEKYRDCPQRYKPESVAPLAGRIPDVFDGSTKIRTCCSLAVRYGYRCVARCRLQPSVRPYKQMTRAFESYLR